jgi:hypothetical protein
MRFLVMVATWLACVSALLPVQGAERPNVILILTDDKY